MSRIWSCEAVFISQPSCSEPLTKSFEVSKNPEIKKGLKPLFPADFTFIEVDDGVDLKRNISESLTRGGGLTSGRVILASLTSHCRPHNLDGIPLPPCVM